MRGAKGWGGHGRDEAPPGGLTRSGCSNLARLWKDRAHVSSKPQNRSVEIVCFVSDFCLIRIKTKGRERKFHSVTACQSNALYFSLSDRSDRGICLTTASQISHREVDDNDLALV